MLTAAYALLDVVLGQVGRYLSRLLWVGCGLADWAGAADGPWLCRELAAVGTGREGGERSRGGDGL